MTASDETFDTAVESACRSGQLALGFDGITRNAYLSTDLRYRYLLHRRWGYGDRMAWIMLNPSTADSDIDDPTIVRCMGFARRWGFSGMVVVNRFALRSTDPDQLMASSDPFGPDNGQWLNILPNYQLVVAAWGSHKAVRKLNPPLPAVELQCLAVNGDGQPRHPLYVRGDAQLSRWERR